MLQLVNLDDRVRKLMLDELEADIEKGVLYISPRLTDAGQRAFPSLMRAAIQHHDDAWLADQLRLPGLLITTEQKAKPRGGYTMARVPATAPDTLAEGEFNRLYARALCRLAIEDGIPELEVYRAKDVRQPRAESRMLMGTRINAQALLNDLRTHQGVDTALRLPPGPNSGLSVRLLIQGTGSGSK